MANCSSKLFIAAAERYRRALADRYSCKKTGTGNRIALQNDNLFSASAVSVHPAHFDQIRAQQSLLRAPVSRRPTAVMRLSELVLRHLFQLIGQMRRGESLEIAVSDPIWN